MKMTARRMLWPSLMVLFGQFLFSPFLVRAAEDAAAKPLQLGKLKVGKVLFLGNSITLHPPAPQIGWVGNWGMAATTKEKDYVHLVAADIAKAAGSNPEIMVRNIADFEREHTGYEIEKSLKPELDFKADVIVVAIGENVPELTTDDAREKYASAFAKLLATLQKDSHPVLFVRSSFWANAPKDEIMRKASADAGAVFIDIAKLGADPANAARSEQKIEHDGVAGHPGDKGMRAIATAIFEAMKKRGELVKN